MEDRVLRKLFLGFIHIHILHHATEHPVYGAWMVEKLHGHGYDISAGTLYPILHGMEKDGLLVRTNETVDGHVRKNYETTEKGILVLKAARQKANELVKEIKE